MAESLTWSLSGSATLIALVVGYLFGSIPFGIILTKLAGGPDLRSIGSGNIGATNVLRTGNKKLAAATLVGDMLKGTAAVLVAWHWLGGPQAALAAAIGAFLGHLFPVWIGFRGGKGVATYLGVLIGVNGWVALAFAAIWLAVAWLSRYSSLSALTASVLTPILLWFAAGMHQAALVMAALTLLLWVMHRTNIARLLAGSEGKIGQKG
ncbi:glycerol-3-phosphate 1-O-acyltransferase PlsY [Bosea sp. (in: a-proteobacteria)]|uniref:glycerol-3-phosphate 1-O-acyltransferase PlsY n=1 Tax=Bosea sp. (in: a-proteobacteria) TaxID=1871050 RepID=UPI00333EDF4E